MWQDKHLALHWSLDASGSMQEKPRGSAKEVTDSSLTGLPRPVSLPLWGFCQIATWRARLEVRNEKQGAHLADKASSQVPAINFNPLLGYLRDSCPQGCREIGTMSLFVVYFRVHTFDLQVCVCTMCNAWYLKRPEEGLGLQTDVEPHVGTKNQTWILFKNKKCF